MDGAEISVEVRELLHRRREAMHALEIVDALTGGMTGTRAKAVRFALLCDDGLDEVHNDVYFIRDQSAEVGPVSLARSAGDHGLMVLRAREAFTAIGLDHDPSLVGQPGYPDIVLTGLKRVAVDCQDASRGYVTATAVTLAEVHRRNYLRVIGGDVEGRLIVSEGFAADAVEAAYQQMPCGLLGCSILDRTADFARRFCILAGEVAEALASPGLLDVRLESLLEQKRREHGEVVAVLKALGAAGRPLGVEEICRGVAETYDIVLTAERLDAVLSKLTSPNLRCIEMRGEGWDFLCPLPKGWNG